MMPSLSHHLPILHRGRARDDQLLDFLGICASRNAGGTETCRLRKRETVSTRTYPLTRISQWNTPVSRPISAYFPNLLSYLLPVALLDTVFICITTFIGALSYPFFVCKSTTWTSLAFLMLLVVSHSCIHGGSKAQARYGVAHKTTILLPPCKIGLFPIGPLWANRCQRQFPLD